VRAQVLDQGLVEARHWGNRSFDRRCRRIARRGSGAVAPILRQECCACNYFARTEHRGDTVGAAPGILRRMRLQPNPPRLITVALALVLGGVGLTMDRQLAYLCLFACPSLLVIGSLLPGI